MTAWLIPGPLGGALAPWGALRFLARHPRLWLLCLAPFLINLGLFAFFFWFSYTRFEQWVGALVPTGEGWWWALAFYLLVILAALLVLAVAALVFTTVGSIIAAPFLELLTRRVEALAGDGGASPWAETTLWQDTLRVLRQSLKRLALFLALMIPLWLINLIPLLGSLVYAPLAFAVTCWFLTLNFVDYPLDRRGLSLRAKLAYTKGLGLTGLAFGAAVFVLSLVPLLNLACLPLAAVGGTLLYLERPGGGVPPQPNTGRGGVPPRP